ncbi:hypothetical protein KFE25_001771 [Diacronema lutheri]|uniref:Methyltransferase domain-containing protein n=1 Tax=Diacronema lutheri TaxID=2081491 RepID=A0A8J6CCZ2_DIALT|nr:hypothetical protein KFE25_001771 [Diacronema lutheri]
MRPSALASMLLLPAAALPVSPPLVSDGASALGLDLVPTACASRVRLGHRGDGGWDVCWDGHTQGGCVVYSAGTFNDPSFDLAIAARGCEVHAFDPTLDELGLASSIRTSLGANPNVTFHRVGLGGRDLIHPTGTAPWQFPGIGFGRFANGQPWELRTLESLMRSLGHARLSVLKVDVEGAEWPLLERILSDSRMRRRLRAGELFRQLLVEVHLLPSEADFQFWAGLSRPRSFSGWLERIGLVPPPRYPVPSSADARAFNAHALDMLAQLRSHGFALFSMRVNVHSPFMATLAEPAAPAAGARAEQPRPPQFSCYELGFVWRSRATASAKRHASSDQARSAARKAAFKASALRARHMAFLAGRGRTPRSVRKPSRHGLDDDVAAAPDAAGGAMPHRR